MAATVARYFKRKAVAIGSTAAVAIGARVGVGVQELFDQVVIGRVQLHAVHSGLHGQLGGVCIFSHGSINVFLRHRVGLHLGRHALGVGVHLAFQRCAGGTDRVGSSGQLSFCHHPAAMHQLGHDLAALGMNRLRS